MKRSSPVTALSLLVLCFSLLFAACGMGRESGGEERRQGDPGPARPGPASEGRIHPSPIAGTWYPADPTALRELLEGFLERAPGIADQEAARLEALIVPHAGYAFSGQTAAYGYRVLGQRRPRRVVLLGPSHYASFRGLSLGDYDAYETPLGRVPVDPEGRSLARGCPLVDFHEEAHLREHSVDIQIPFLQVLFPDDPPRIVPLLVGSLREVDYPRVASCIRGLLDPETVLVVSSDFTHYGPRYGYLPFPLDGRTAERLRALDEGACGEILRLDRKGFLAYQARTGITICGYRPIALLLEMLSPRTRARRLFYTTSGRVTGDYRNSVSYCSLIFLQARGSEGPGTAPPPKEGKESAMKDGRNPPGKTGRAGGGLDPSEKATLLRLSRDTLEAYIRRHETPDPLGGGYAITEALRQPRGAFVTLTKGGRLRGCIGYIQPIAPLYRTVQENTINAATRDTRFPPVSPEELPEIHIEISALSVPEPVASYREIEIGKHGIILKHGYAQAVFLPQVAPEQGWDLPETLRHLSLKAGLAPDAWRDPEAEFLVFTAEVFEEPRTGVEEKP